MKRNSLILVVTVAALMVSFMPVSPPVGAQEEDTTVTLWFGIFNNPEFCTGGGPGVCTSADFPQNGGNPAVQASFLFGAGQRVQSNGQASFAGALSKGSTLGAVFGPGLLDPMKAEVQLVLRTHGPVLPDLDLLDQEVSTFNGGCPPNTCANVQAAIHRAAEADATGRSFSNVLRLSNRSEVPEARSTLWRSEKGLIGVVNTELK